MRLTVMSLLALVLTSVFSVHTFARDDRSMFSYSEALATASAKEKLGDSIKFYFGEKSPAVAKNFGEFTSNKKTNAANKSDKEACQWAFLSAMISLRDRAVQLGGNAVINIHSFYKKNVNKDEKNFECGAGTFVAGVTLKGTVVTLK